MKLENIRSAVPKAELKARDLCRQVWDCGQNKQYALSIDLMQKHNQRWTIAEKYT